MCGLDGFHQSCLSTFHDLVHLPFSDQNSSYHWLCTTSKSSYHVPYSSRHPLSYPYMPKPNPPYFYVQHAVTCPNHLNLPRFTKIDTESIPNHDTISWLDFLSLKLTSHIILIILLSPLSNLLISCEIWKDMISGHHLTCAGANIKHTDVKWWWW